MMVRRRLAGMSVAAVGAWLAVAPLVAQAPDPNAVRQRLYAYLTGYERDLGDLVADERFEQWPLDGAVPHKAQEPGTYFRDAFQLRVIESTVAFVSLPANAGWLGFRDVQRVKGKPVKRKGLPLADLLGLETVDARDRALALLLESARHNLGAPRTTNLPSLPLELLHRRNEARFVLEQSSRDRVGDCEALRLDLQETGRPTLIQRPSGGDMPSHVAAWVEVDTGRLCKAEVRTRDGQHGVSKFEAIVAVDFARDAAIGLTVPARLREVFLVPPRGAGEGEATYSNYRRVIRASR
ncbi:MAG: hypothetical protein U0P30_16775 [Vicinamibacterales bacterium]